jgi:hypothetical protein
VAFSRSTCTPSELILFSSFVFRRYSPLRERLEKEGKPVVLLPELQEVNSLKCDTGSARSVLEADPEFAGLDFSLLDSAPSRHDGNDWTSKKGFFSPEQVGERAKWVRNWLRGRKEEKIVVVSRLFDSRGFGRRSKN